MRCKRRDHPKHKLSAKASQARSIAKKQDAQRRKEHRDRDAANDAYQRHILALYEKYLSANKPTADL